MFWPIQEKMIQVGGSFYRQYLEAIEPIVKAEKKKRKAKNKPTNMGVAFKAAQEFKDNYDNQKSNQSDFFKKLGLETDKEGTVTKVIYGITRIPDTMALEEMKQYEYGLNVDRLIALASLIAFVKLQNANKGYKKRFETEDKEYLQKSDEIYKLSSKSPFKHMGRNGSNKSQKPIRKPFKNIR